MAESEPGGEIARSELRASYDDRDRVVGLLRVSAGDGRLTAEELDERLERAMTARTYGELARLVSDLPAEGSVASPATAAQAPQAKEVARIDLRSGHVQRVDRWTVPQRMDVKVTSGHVKLDFTEAVITQPIEVFCHCDPPAGRGPGGHPDRPREASDSPRRDQPCHGGPGGLAGGVGETARAWREPGLGGHRGTGGE